MAEVQSSMLFEVTSSVESLRVFVWMHMYACLHVCGCACGDQRSTSGVIPHILLPFFFVLFVCLLAESGSLAS